MALPSVVGEVAYRAAAPQFRADQMSEVHAGYLGVAPTAEARGMLAGRVGGARRAPTRVCWCDDVLVEQRIRAMQAAGAGDAVKIRCTFIRDNPNSRAIS